MVQLQDIQPLYKDFPLAMSPEIYRERGLVFSFYSREEPRMHIHVFVQGGEAKFWLEPEVEMAYSDGLSKPQLRIAERVVKERQHEFVDAWRKYFHN